MQGMGSERETEQGTTRGWGGGSARVSQHRPAWQGDVPRGHSWRGGGRTRASLGHQDLRPKTLWNAHVQRPGPRAQPASWPGHLGTWDHASGWAAGPPQGWDPRPAGGWAHDLGPQEVRRPSPPGHSGPTTPPPHLPWCRCWR